jgi:Toastrack DUF4097
MTRTSGNPRWVPLRRATVLAVGMLTLASVALAGTDRSFEWSGRLGRGQTIEIKSVNGEIEAEYTSGDKVEVTAVKRWNRSDPDEVTIEVIEHDGGVTICTRYPGRGNSCGVGEGGHMNVNHNDVSVDYVVRVPAGVTLAARTVNGSVDVVQLRGPVEATSVNGSIHISTSGQAEAKTVNGSINVTIGTAQWKDDLAFTTVNGRIELTLPEDTGAEVHATTVNGDISTDLPLKVRGRFGPRSVNGTIGEGGGGLHLTTVNGGISLRTNS